MGRKPLLPTERKPRLTGAQRRKKQYEAEETAAAAPAPPAAPKRGGAKIREGAQKSAPPSVPISAPTPAKRGRKNPRLSPTDSSSPTAEPEPTPDGDEWAQEFREAGNPDLENPDTDLDYVRKLQLIVLRQMATTPHPSKAQQDAWRRIREMSAVVGMTSNRAKLEAEVRALKKMLSGYQARGGAIKVEQASNVPRPHTARGRKRNRPPSSEEPPAAVQ